MIHLAFPTQKMTYQRRTRCLFTEGQSEKWTEGRDRQSRGSTRGERQCVIAEGRFHFNPRSPLPAPSIIQLWLLWKVEEWAGGTEAQWGRKTEKSPHGGENTQHCCAGCLQSDVSITRGRVSSINDKGKQKKELLCPLHQIPISMARFHGLCSPRFLVYLITRCHLVDDYAKWLDDEHICH